VRCRMRPLSWNDAPGTHAEGWLDCRVGWRAFYTKSRGELSLPPLANAATVPLWRERDDPIVPGYGLA
jgi:hypothetical protein